MEQLQNKSDLFLYNVLSLLIFLTPLVVIPPIFLSFYIGKWIVLRALVHIMACYLLYAYITRRFNFKIRSPIFIAVSCYISIVFVADVFSVNPMRSFLGGFERMDGFVSLLYFYLFFTFLLITLTTQRQWNRVFHLSLFSSVLVCFLAFSPKFFVSMGRLASVFNNPLYLAVYLMFNFWITLDLLLQKIKVLKYGSIPSVLDAQNNACSQHNTKAAPIKTTYFFIGLYLAILVVLLTIIFKTASRGIILALLISCAYVAGRLLLRKRQSIYIFLKTHFRAFVLSSIIGCTTFIFIMDDIGQILQHSLAVRRFMIFDHNWTIEPSLYSRFIIWGVALRGFLERPILGWGQENFYAIYQKFYDTRLWFEKGFFDRAHNQFLDILTQSGAFGFITYLVIFCVIYLQLKKSYQKKQICFYEYLIFLGLLISYCIHAFSFFDSFGSYLMLFTMFGYLHFKTQKYTQHHFQWISLDHISKHTRFFGLLSVSILGLCSYITLYLPVRNAYALQAFINDVRSSRPIDRIIADLKISFHPCATGVFEVLNNLYVLGPRIYRNPMYSTDEHQKFLKFIIHEGEKKLNSKHSFVILQRELAEYYIAFAMIDSKHKDFYLRRAEQILLTTITKAPDFESLYYNLAIVYERSNKPVDRSAILYAEWLRSRKSYDKSWNRRATAEAILAAKRVNNTEMLNSILDSTPLTHLHSMDQYRIKIALSH